TIKGENFKYLIKVRRHNLDDCINIRYKESLKELHSYKIVAIDGRSLELELISSKIEEVKSKKELHIAWCKIDIKSIEKILPSLNEIGVSKISFIGCDRSQNVKLDFKRFERVLEASMQQCGRSSYMEFDIYKNIAEFIEEFPDTKVFDFCENSLKDGASFKRVLIGAEGGFSQEEKSFLSSQEVFRLDTPMVLRSESAVMAVASKIVL
ncbi:MAG: 16S rRNA (uracil(1498)-N(3))-methyltransferase, partial [Campylobacterota bacterium]|nr:16S rRNA (uracil(1498)-N(3))-methyltransferase [Campylobacterota bacterium]